MTLNDYTPIEYYVWTLLSSMANC